MVLTSVPVTGQGFKSQICVQEILIHALDLNASDGAKVCTKHNFEPISNMNPNIHWISLDISSKQTFWSVLNISPRPASVA